MYEPLILPELSYRAIGCVYEVHRVLGRGLLESSYQEALAIELGLAGPQCEREFPVALHYKRRRIQGFRLDLVVAGQIILECKTSESITPAHQAQLQNYLRVSGLPLGILVLFGTKVTYERVVGSS